MKDQDKKEVKVIDMVDNALKVLELLKAGSVPKGVSEIAKTCGLNPSSVCRMLKTMEMYGWVFQLSDDRYIPGEKLSFSTIKNNFYYTLQEVSSVIMETYAKKHNAPMNLMVRDGSHCVIIQQARTKNIVDYISPKFSRLPFYTCASGKILLSELSLKVIDDIIRHTEMKPLTPNTICNPDDFWIELRKTAKCGYAFDYYESSLIGSAVAVPIRDYTGTIIASLSFCGLMGVGKAEEMEKYVPILNEASGVISNSLYKMQ